MMISITQFDTLVAALQRDDKYLSIEDPRKRMRYMVEKYARQLERASELVMEKCGQYERAYRKSTSKALFNQTNFNILFDKYLSDGGLSNGDYHAMINSSNIALLNFPLKDADWSQLVPFLEVYVKRAQVHYDYDQIDEALCDLSHASSVLKLVDPVEIIEEPSDHVRDLLLRLMILKANYLAKRYEDERTFQFVKNSDENIEDILTGLESVDAILARDEQKVSDNFYVSPKLRLVNTKDLGRFFTATKPILRGEHILRERANTTFIFVDNCFKHCSYCCRPITTFWPCVGCTALGFCSQRCSALASDCEMQFECGIYHLLIGEQANYYTLPHMFRWLTRYGIDAVAKFEEQHSFDMNAYMDSDVIRTKPIEEWTTAEHDLQGGALSSLISHRGEREQHREICISVLSSSVVYALIHKGLLSAETTEDVDALSNLLELISTGMMRMCTNGFCMSKEKRKSDNTIECIKLGSCLCTVASMFNHSCTPNVYWHFNYKDGATIHMIAMRNIAPNEPLTVSYGPKANLSPFALRQLRLRKDYCFYCQCEACLKDAANSSSTLRCLSLDLCDGPLVMLSEFQACLVCGRSFANAHYKGLLAKKYELSFNRAIRKIRPKCTNRFVKYIPIINCIYPDVKAQLEVKSQLGPDNEMLKEASYRLKRARCGKPKKPNPIKLSLVTPERIDKIEKRFSAYLKLAYGGGYSFLDNCIKMLEFYHEIGRRERGLQLIDLIDRCLGTVYPKFVDASLVKLVYMLDYAAHFYHHLACEHEFQIAELVTKTQDDFDLEYKSELRTSSWFWGFCGRLNTKLFDIFQYDLIHRGEFFPKLKAQLARAESASMPPEDAAIKLSSSELYFRQLYDMCRNRLATVEHICEKE